MELEQGAVHPHKAQGKAMAEGVEAHVEGKKVAFVDKGEEANVDRAEFVALDEGKETVVQKDEEA